MVRSNIFVKEVHKVSKFSLVVFPAYHCEWSIFLLVSAKAASGMKKYPPMTLGRLKQMLDMRP